MTVELEETEPTVWCHNVDQEDGRIEEWFSLDGDFREGVKSFHRYVSFDTLIEVYEVLEAYSPLIEEVKWSNHAEGIKRYSMTLDAMGHIIRNLIDPYAPDEENKETIVRIHSILAYSDLYKQLLYFTSGIEHSRFTIMYLEARQAWEEQQ